MLTLKHLETTCMIRNVNVPNFNVHITMYPIRALLHDQSFVLKEDIFQYRRKKLLLVGGLNTDAMGLENKDFSDKDQCQCMYIFFI